MKGKYLGRKCPKCGNKIDYYSRKNGLCCCKCDTVIEDRKDLIESHSRLNDSWYKMMGLPEQTVDDAYLEEVYNDVSYYDTKKSIIETVKYWAWKNKFKESAYCDLDITITKNDSDEAILTLLSSHPGCIIGKGGQTIDELKELLLLIKGFNTLEIKEVQRIV